MPTKAASGFRAQTWGQWAATVKGIGGPELADPKACPPGPALDWWKKQFALKRKPAQARDDWKKHKGGDFSASAAKVHALHTKKGAKS